MFCGQTTEKDFPMFVLTWVASPEVFRGLPFPILRGLSCCLSGICLVSLAHLEKEELSLC